jgi:CheY-like chemotaxis protein
MDGLEATRRIKAARHGDETAIVLLTANGMGEERRILSACGADDFVAKPCGEDELLETMRALLEITYDYEEESKGGGKQAGTAALSAARLGRLAPELLEELRNATVSGNKRLLDELIGTVRKSGDGESASALQKLADKYDYDLLTELLEGSMP